MTNGRILYAHWSTMAMTHSFTIKSLWLKMILNFLFLIFMRKPFHFQKFQVKILMSR